ncbi:hypothetical protein OF83DRAFT_691460 [Amylostereum chailletii]|nr:hypothetical protein OF83DRAFT_691460 [Amylostereum chailletii]
MPYDDEKRIAKKLEGLRFRLDRRTGAIAVNEEGKLEEEEEEGSASASGGRTPLTRGADTSALGCLLRGSRQGVRSSSWSIFLRRVSWCVLFAMDSGIFTDPYDRRRNLCPIRSIIPPVSSFLATRFPLEHVRTRTDDAQLPRTSF